MAKSVYWQHRRGAIVWVHDHRQPHHTPEQHEAAWHSWIDQVAAGTAGMKEAAVVGSVDDDTARWLHQHAGIDLGTRDIVATRDRIQHALNEGKAQRGAGVTPDDLKAMPRHMKSPQAILWDTESPALLYVFHISASRRGKYIVRVNFTQKGMGTFNSLRTAGTLEAADLSVPRYQTIKGQP